MTQVTILPGLDDPVFIARNIRPWIYLDHWALRYFSSDKVGKEKFLSAFLGKNATLCISTVNLFEILNHKCAETIKQIKDFYDRIGDRFFFIDVNISQVFDREQRLLKKQYSQNPSLDEVTCRQYVTDIFQRGFKSVSYSNVRNVKRKLRENEKLSIVNGFSKTQGSL